MLYSIYVLNRCRMLLVQPAPLSAVGRGVSYLALRQQMARKRRQHRIETCCWNAEAYGC